MSEHKSTPDMQLSRAMRCGAERPSLDEWEQSRDIILQQVKKEDKPLQFGLSIGRGIRRFFLLWVALPILILLATIRQVFLAIGFLFEHGIAIAILFVWIVLAVSITFFGCLV